MPSPEQRANEAQRSQDHRPRSLKILLAEDGHAHQRLAQVLLKKWGHSTCIAGDGEATLALYQQTPCDLILMDLQMPELDGFETTRRIRELESTSARHIPIVAMTAGAGPNDRQRCLNAGMDEYLTKPISRREFEAVLARLDARFNLLQCGTDSTADSQPLIDWEVALVSVDGDVELLTEVIAASLEELPILLAGLQSSLDLDDAQESRRFAHTTKATGRTFGIPSLLELATQIEMAAGSENLDKARELTPELVGLASRVMEALQRRLDP